MQMHTASFRPLLIGYGGITLVAFAIAFLFRQILHVNQATAALSFLMLILVVASRWRLSYSIYLSLLCALVYNFCFLPPVGTLAIADPQNWVTLVAFLCASFLVGHLSDNARRQTEISTARRLEVEHLYTFSQQLLLQDDLRTVARLTPSMVTAVFNFRSAALYIREGDALYYSDPESEMLSAVDLKQAAQSVEPGITVVDGIHVLPLILGMRSMGALAFRGEGNSTGMYEAIGTLVAIALERAAALERTSHMEAARESERLRSALLDSVTHDLRTPLTSIRAAATMLSSQPDLPERERLEMYAVLDEESSRLDRLIGQAVEMAQLDSASIQVTPHLEDVREIISLAMEESRPLLGERPIVIDVPNDLPKVSMDRALVRRVLGHLIENAVKYSPPNSTLRISAKIEGFRLLISLEDHGPGIENAEQPFVFDKFFRGSAHRSGISGTGMGLAIVKAIMIAHNGGVELVSHPPSGSTFTFWLPFESVETNHSV